MWNLKRNYTNELTHKTETDSQTYGCWQREEWTEEIVREFGMDMYILLCLKWITNKDLL